MAPLILHNVPDEELYVGDDGIQRPYAMVFPQYVLLHVDKLSEMSNALHLQAGRIAPIEEDDARDRLLWQIDAPNEVKNSYTRKERRPDDSSGR